MGLNNSTLLAGPTISATGGVSKTLTIDGLEVANGVHLIDASVTDYKTRPGLTAKVRQPVYSKPTKAWSKGKKSLTYTVPFVDANGEMQFPLVRCELEDHPDMTDAQYTALMLAAAQFWFDTDFAAFYKTGSMA